MQRPVLVVALIAGVFVAGCDRSPAKTARSERRVEMQRARTIWNHERPDAYTLRTHLEQTFGNPPSGDYVLGVTGRRVIAVRRVDGTRLALGPQWTDFSVDGTFDVLASLLRPRDTYSDTVAVSYDRHLGYPRRIDVKSKASDGGWSARYELSSG